MGSELFLAIWIDALQPTPISGRRTGRSNQLLFRRIPSFSDRPARLGRDRRINLSFPRSPPSFGFSSPAPLPIPTRPETRKLTKNSVFFRPTRPPTLPRSRARPSLHRACGACAQCSSMRRETGSNASFQITRDNSEPNRHPFRVGGRVDRINFFSEEFRFFPIDPPA